MWRPVDWAEANRQAGIGPGEPQAAMPWLQNEDAVAMLREMRDAAQGEGGWLAPALKLERDLTMLHGDFHKGNVRPDTHPRGIGMPLQRLL